MVEGGGMFSDKLEWGHFRDDQQGRFNFRTIVQLSLCRGRRGCLGDQGRFNLVQSSLCRGAPYYVHILCISLHRIQRNLQGGILLRTHTISLHRIQRNWQGGTRGAGFVAGGLLRRRGAVCLHHQHHHDDINIINITVIFFSVLIISVIIIDTVT